MKRKKKYKKRVEKETENERETRGNGALEQREREREREERDVVEITICRRFLNFFSFQTYFLPFVWVERKGAKRTETQTKSVDLN